MAENLLTPRQVGAALNVSESTVRRWCDRGVLHSQTTAGGHRRIDVGAVLAFARQRGLVVSDETALGVQAGGGRTASDAELSRRFLVAIREGDDATATRVLEQRIVAGVHPGEVFDHIAAPALHEVGAMWERGEIEVYQEHRASTTALVALTGLQTLLPGETLDAPLAISAAVAGDHSMLATTMVAITLRATGYRVIALGANSPAGTVCRALEDLQPRIAAVSISHAADADDIVDQLNTIHDTASREGCALAVGGYESTADIRRRVRADFFGETLAHLIQFAERVRSGG